MENPRTITKLFKIGFLSALLSFPIVAFAESLHEIELKLKKYLIDNKGKEYQALRLNAPRDISTRYDLNLLSIEDDTAMNRLIVIVNASGMQYKMEVRYTQTVQIPVLNKSLRKGDIITDNMIIISGQSKERVRASTITDPSQIIGQSARKHIHKGSPISISDIGPSDVIKKGQRVTLQFRKGNLLIETAGIAMQPGGVGEIIKLHNSESGKSVVGRVKSAEIVEVGRS